MLLSFMLIKKKSVRDHTFMTSTWNVGGGVLKFVTCLRILLFLKIRYIVHFADGGGRGVKKLVIFCGRHKWMTPNQLKIHN